MYFFLNQYILLYFFKINIGVLHCLLDVYFSVLHFSLFWPQCFVCVLCKKKKNYLICAPMCHIGNVDHVLPAPEVQITDVAAASNVSLPSCNDGTVGKGKSVCGKILFIFFHFHDVEFIIIWISLPYVSIVHIVFSVYLQFFAYTNLYFCRGVNWIGW